VVRHSKRLGYTVQSQLRRVSGQTNTPLSFPQASDETTNAVAGDFYHKMVAFDYHKMVAFDAPAAGSLITYALRSQFVFHSGVSADSSFISALEYELGQP